MVTQRPHTRQDITPEETYPEYPAPISKEELEREVNGAPNVSVWMGTAAAGVEGSGEGEVSGEDDTMEG